MKVLVINGSLHKKGCAYTARSERDINAWLRKLE